MRRGARADGAVAGALDGSPGNGSGAAADADFIGWAATAAWGKPPDPPPADEVLGRAGALVRADSGSADRATGVSEGAVDGLGELA